MLTIDFETEGIVGNPVHKPPRPVGVALKWDGQPSRYFAWGHPTENNCTWEAARREVLVALAAAEATGAGWLAHNAAFECAVLREHFGYVPPDPLHVHDTMYDLFLYDPYAYSFALKPSAERLLDMPPEEQGELRDWILRNVPEAKASDWGAYICRAPGGMVGKYAVGDTDRTYLLREKIHPLITAWGMEAAYQREQRLQPILSASSVRGMPVDVQRLARDIEVYLAARRVSEDYIFSRLGVFELTKDAQLAEALDRAGLVTEWVLTPTGKRSTARKNLAGRVRDPHLLAHLAYHGALTTCLGTFAGPWLELAMADGHLHPQWNQVKGNIGEGGDKTGTKTGRMSCRDPNLQNVPTEFEGLVIPPEIEQFFATVAPHLPRIMYMRNYLIPGDGRVWLKRDFSAQEMRILAHFAEGKLFDAWQLDPTADPHRMVQEMLKSELGIDMVRKYVKITAFGIVYGRGIPNLSAALGVPLEEGKRFRDAYFALLPEVQALSYATRRRGSEGAYITTWGGRRYYREPSPDRDLSYKLLNYLIQGSAADQTKQAIIDHDAARAPEDLLLAAVHDEMNISAPADRQADAMRALRTAMDAPRFDVPFRSEGFASSISWGDIESYEPA